jgi:hypothetical protein
MLSTNSRKSIALHIEGDRSATVIVNAGTSSLISYAPDLRQAHIHGILEDSVSCHLSVHGMDFRGEDTGNLIDRGCGFFEAFMVPVATAHGECIEHRTVWDHLSIRGK